MPPNCADPARRRTVLSLAMQGTIQATQTILEEAIRENNPELITNSSEMLRKVLQGNRNENDAETGSMYMIDSYQPNKPHFLETFSGRVECKPEDCQRCFFKAICDSEETEAIISRAQELMKDLKYYVPKTDRYRSRDQVAF